jgi:hypothetical protein
MRRVPFAAPFALALAVCVSPAVGGLIVTIDGDSGPAAPGSTNNFFDVVLRHDAPAQAKADVNNYSVDLILPAGSGVTFHAPDAATAGTALPYIFSNIGGGVGQLESITNGGLRLVFNDAALNAAAAELVTLGESFGLGRVFYDVAAGATPGATVPVLFGPATDLGDANGNLVPFTTVPGAVTIAPAAAPEPGSILLLSLVGAGAFVTKRLRRRSVTRDDVTPA